MTSPYNNAFPPYSQPVGFGYPPYAGLPPAGRVNTLPLTTGYSQPINNPVTQFNPSTGVSPLNTQFQPTSADSRQKKWLLWAGGLGTAGLAGLLTLIYHKRPNWLQLWKSKKTEVAQVAEKQAEAALPAIPLKPLSFYNDKEAILQRHALSVDIINELWPEVLKYAEHKPPGWEKALEEKYNQIIRNKLNVPDRGRVIVEFVTDPARHGSSCERRTVPLSLEIKKQEPFVVGSLEYAPSVTHFNPSCLDSSQRAFTALTHETDHLLRGLAQNEAQCAAAREVGGPKSIPFGEYIAGPNFLKKLMEKERTSFPASDLLPILRKQDWADGKFESLTQPQRDQYWQFLKKEWEKPGCEQWKSIPAYKKMMNEGIQKYTPEQLQTAIEMTYLSELEAHALAMYRAPGVPCQVMARDIQDHSRVFELRQMIQAYYEHFKIPPERQSDLVKNWELKLIPNPQDSAV